MDIPQRGRRRGAGGRARAGAEGGWPPEGHTPEEELLFDLESGMTPPSNGHMRRVRHKRAFDNAAGQSVTPATHRSGSGSSSGAGAGKGAGQPALSPSPSKPGHARARDATMSTGSASGGSTSTAPSPSAASGKGSTASSPGQNRSGSWGKRGASARDQENLKRRTSEKERSKQRNNQRDRKHLDRADSDSFMTGGGGEEAYPGGASSGGSKGGSRKRPGAGSAGKAPAHTPPHSRAGSKKGRRNRRSATSDDDFPPDPAASTSDSAGAGGCESVYVTSSEEHTLSDAPLNDSFDTGPEGAGEEGGPPPFSMPGAQPVIEPIPAAELERFSAWRDQMVAQVSRTQSRSIKLENGAPLEAAGLHSGPGSYAPDHVALHKACRYNRDKCAQCASAFIQTRMECPLWVEFNDALWKGLRANLARRAYQAPDIPPSYALQQEPERFQAQLADFVDRTKHFRMPPPRVEPYTAASARQRHSALVAIQEHLAELHELEACFPTLRHFQGCPGISTPEVQNRLSAMVAWSRLTEALQNALEHMHELIGVLQFRNAARLWIVKEVQPVGLVDAPSAAGPVTTKAKRKLRGWRKKRPKAFSILGQTNPDLTLERGHTYIFQVDCPGHYFEIQDEDGKQYNTGVTNNGCAHGSVMFKVSHDCPSWLQYGCSTDHRMRGHIAIKGQKRTNSKKLESKCREYVQQSIHRIGLADTISSLNGQLVDVLSRASKYLIEQTTDQVQDHESMNLPSFVPLFLYLAQIPLYVATDCLIFIRNYIPTADSSLETINFYLNECSEVALSEAIRVKSFYLEHIRPVLLPPSEFRAWLWASRDKFERSLCTAFRDYLGVTELQAGALLAPDSLDASRSFVESLPDKWNFAKEVGLHVRTGEDLVVDAFARVNRLVFSQSGSCLSIIARAWSKGEVKDADSCRALRENFLDFRQRAVKCVGFAKTLRKDLEVACELELTGMSKETIFQALGDSGHVLVSATPGKRASLLGPSTYVFCPEYAWSMDDDVQTQLLELLASPIGVEPSDKQGHLTDSYLLFLHGPSEWSEEADASDDDHDDDDGYPEGEGSDRDALSAHPTLEPTVSASGDRTVSFRTKTQRAVDHVFSRALNYHGYDPYAAGAGMSSQPPSPDVDGTLEPAVSLTLIVRHSSQLRRLSGTFQSRLQEHCPQSSVRLTFESKSWKQSIQASLADTQKLALDVSVNIVDNLRRVTPHLHNSDRHTTLHRVQFDVAQSCYRVAFEYLTEVIRLQSGSIPREVVRRYPVLASEWCELVEEECRDMALRRPPRWAKQGLEFIKLATLPEICGHLSLSELHRFRSKVDRVLQVWSPSRHLSEPVLRRLSSGSTPMALSSPMMTPDSSSQLDCLEIDEQYLSQGAYLSAFSRHHPKQLPPIGRVLGNHRSKVKREDDLEEGTTISFRWQLGRKLGRGSFGSVHIAMNLQTKGLLAVKKVMVPSKTSERNRVLSQVRSEWKIIAQLKCDHLVQYFGIEYHKDKYLLFMEYCPNSTLGEHTRADPLPLDAVRKYTAQILSGILVLHDHGIVHRDLKCDNIFLDANMNAKVGDFGSCTKLNNPARTEPGEISELVGTVAFMAPEVVTEAGHGRGADIWSLGCCVYEMITGEIPYRDRFSKHGAVEFRMSVIFHLGAGRIKRPSSPPQLKHDGEGRDFLRVCFLGSEERPAAAELMSHPFVQANLGFGPVSSA